MPQNHISRNTDIFNFSIRLGTLLQQVEKISDLGIVLDSKWSFNDHLRQVINKAFKVLGFMKRTTRYFSSASTITHIFKTLILPNLNYGSIIWSPIAKKDFGSLNSVIKTVILSHIFLKS